MYKEWKSFEEEIPKSECGLLIKIVMNNRPDEWNTKNKFYYGYILPGTKDKLYLCAEINGPQLDTMSWNAWKEFEPNELFWLYSSVCYFDHNQPERSKREDFDCCQRVKDLQALQEHYENIYEGLDGEFGHDHEHDDYCKLMQTLVDESKMRCSEHCGNTVRTK